MEANGKKLRTTMTATAGIFMNHLEAIVRIKSAANVFVLPTQVKQILPGEDFGDSHSIQQFEFLPRDIAGELMREVCMAKIRDSERTAISLPCAANGLAAIIDANCKVQRSDHAQKPVDPLRRCRYFHWIVRTKTCVAAGARSSDLAALA